MARLRRLRFALSINSSARFSAASMGDWDRRSSSDSVLFSLSSIVSKVASSRRPQPARRPSSELGKHAEYGQLPQKSTSLEWNVNTAYGITSQPGEKLASQAREAILSRDWSTRTLTVFPRLPNLARSGVQQQSLSLTPLILRSLSTSRMDRCEGR